MDTLQHAGSAAITAEIRGSRQTRRNAHDLVDLVLLLLIIGTGINFLWWRFSMVDEIDLAGKVLLGIETISILWLTAGVAMMVGRTRPTPAPDPDVAYSLDVLIPVCGEPIEMVRATVQAAQSILWPARIIVANDGFMARKANWEEVEHLCKELGVLCLTRWTGPKGKAGNMNHALLYSNAEFLLTLDADHLVVPDVAQQMLGWFSDPMTGFVSTPQNFHGADKDILNPTESIFYRAIQPSRDRYGLAFSTGNGVMYRRRALNTIGGFSDWSVVEDLHTSIKLHASGWKSVFHHQPISIGVAPETLAEYCKQRVRWASDSLRILRYDPPWRYKGLSLRAKIYYVQTLAFYLVALIQIGFVLGPLASLATRSTLVADTSATTQILRMGPWLATVFLLLVWWGGLRGAARSLRLSALVIPLVSASALWKTLGSKAEAGGVTNKTRQLRFNTLVLAAVGALGVPFGSLVFGLFDPRPGASTAAMIWASAFFVLGAGPVLSITGTKGGPFVWFRRLLMVLAVAASVGAVATAQSRWEPPAGIFQAFRPVADDETDPDRDAVHRINEFGDSYLAGPAITATPEAQRLEPSDEESADDTPISLHDRGALLPGEGIYLGVSTDQAPNDMSEVEGWASEVAEPQIVHWFQQWGSGETRFRGDLVRGIHDQGRVPLITWEPWAKPDARYEAPNQQLGRTHEIAAGEFDEYIDAWATAAAAQGGPILIRPFHEMNGNWYPWSLGLNDNTPESFVAAWRHMVDRFRLAGADNVGFVWSINGLGTQPSPVALSAFYPGDEYVDWVGASAFNWDNSADWATWQTPEQVFGETYQALEAFNKPVLLAEFGTGTNTRDGVDWVTESLNWLSSLPKLQGIVWFDRSYNDRINFYLSPAQRSAMMTAIETNERFDPSLTTATRASR